MIGTRRFVLHKVKKKARYKSALYLTLNHKHRSGLDKNPKDRYMSALHMNLKCRNRPSLHKSQKDSLLYTRL